MGLRRISRNGGFSCSPLFGNYSDYLTILYAPRIEDAFWRQLPFWNRRFFSQAAGSCFAFCFRGLGSNRSGRGFNPSTSPTDRAILR